jgi:hypothetical protein
MGRERANEQFVGLMQQHKAKKYSDNKPAVLIISMKHDVVPCWFMVLYIAVVV